VVDVIALGAVLVLAGLAVLVIEAHVSTAGVLGLAGVLAAAAGVGLIIADLGAALVFAVPVAVVAAFAGMVAIVVVAQKVIAARSQAARMGPDTLIGVTATVRTWSESEGQVAADGTLWRARVSWGWEDPPPALGETVVVNELDGLTVSVRRPHPWEVAPVWAPSSLSL
jgi:membrane-bound serine protease (ClpP class)